jgi:hypothetical protein
MRSVILFGIIVVPFFVTPAVAFLLQAWFLTGDWTRFNLGFYLIAWVLGAFIEMVVIGLFMGEPGLLVPTLWITGTLAMGGLWWAASRAEDADRQVTDRRSGAIDERL